MILSVFIDSFDYLSGLDPVLVIRTFWIFFVFDFPRYILADIYIFIDEMYRRTQSAVSLKKDISDIDISRLPLVSVIVPVLNEQDTIEWTIRSLKEQTHVNTEIIVVDDGSTDNTPEICKRLNDLRMITYLRFTERNGKSAALNYGLQFAKGEYVVFVDSDTTFDINAIYNIIKPLNDPRVGIVSGNLMVRNRDNNILTAMQQIEYLFSISVGRRIRARLGVLPIVSGAFGAFRKELISLDKIGGHEPGPGNDSDLTIRVRKLGYKIEFAPDAICYTTVPEKFYSFIKQRWRWDRNIIKNRVRKHGDVFNPFIKNFKLHDVISSIDSLFYHVVIASLTLIYLMDALINFPHVLPFVLMMNYILYLLAEVLQLFIAIVLTRNPDLSILFLYMPLFNPYKIVLKFFRIIGYIQELFFRYSMHDTFAPYKVRARYIKW